MPVQPTPIKRRRSVAKEWHKTLAIQLCSARWVGLADFQQRRVEVDADDRFVANRSCFRHTWPFDDHRNTDSAFVQHAFRTAQRRVRSGTAVAAIVRAEQDDRVVGKLETVQCVQYTTNTLINARNHRGVLSVGVVSPFCLRSELFGQVGFGLNRCVHGVMCQI